MSNAALQELITIMLDSLNDDEELEDVKIRVLEWLTVGEDPVIEEAAVNAIKTGLSQTEDARLVCASISCLLNVRGRLREQFHDTVKKLRKHPVPMVKGAARSYLSLERDRKKGRL